MITGESSGLTVVVSEQAAKAVTALNLSFGMTDLLARLDETVAESLMVAFAVVVRSKLGQGLAQGAFSEEDHPFEAFGSDAAHRALDLGIQARREQRGKRSENGQDVSEAST